MKKIKITYFIEIDKETGDFGDCAYFTLNEARKVRNMFYKGHRIIKYKEDVLNDVVIEEVVVDTGDAVSLSVSRFNHSKKLETMKTNNCFFVRQFIDTPSDRNYIPNDKWQKISKKDYLVLKQDYSLIEM